MSSWTLSFILPPLFLMIFAPCGVWAVATRRRWVFMTTCLIALVLLLFLIAPLDIVTVGIIVTLGAMQDITLYSMEHANGANKRSLVIKSGVVILAIYLIYSFLIGVPSSQFMVFLIGILFALVTFVGITWFIVATGAWLNRLLAHKWPGLFEEAK